jgi:hypothetical protein
VPVSTLWEAFTRADLWPRWNRCMLWVHNRDLIRNRRLLWAFRPIRRWYPYVLPAVARIVEVKDKKRVTWEVTALPGFYARHTYHMKNLGGGRTRYGSWEKAMGRGFRLTRWFWVTLDGGERTVTVGGREVVLSHPGRAHTSGDLVIWLPEHRIVATGDIFFNGHYPFLDRDEDGASIPGLIRALRDLAGTYPEAVFLPRPRSSGTRGRPTPPRGLPGVPPGERGSGTEGRVGRGRGRREDRPLGLGLVDPAVFPRRQAHLGDRQEQRALGVSTGERPAG